MSAPPRRLRIAVLNRSFVPAAGGAERYSIALVEQLADRHEIHVFAQTIDQCVNGLHYYLVSMPFRKPRWVNQLWFAAATWWATRKGFDIVHSHENTWHGNVQTVHVLPVRYTLFAGRSGWTLFLRRLKVVTSPRLLAYLWLERMRYAPKKGRAVVLISPSLQAIFNATYPKAAPMTCLIPPGINLPPIVATQLARRNARQLLGLPLDSRCILFVANDFRTKGLGVLLKSLALLPENVVLAVVGSSAQLPYFRRQAEMAGVLPRVFFLGALDDVGPAYRAADCLVHPTLEDTFAMVVLEAMGWGLPVVVSSVAYCGIAGLLDDGVNALVLSDPQDATALANVIKRLLDDGPFTTEMGRRARSFAAGFEWSNIALTQEKLYWQVREATQP
jgi:glycosyltransferase involved in cell wall biosynthesis